MPIICFISYLHPSHESMSLKFLMIFSIFGSKIQLPWFLNPHFKRASTQVVIEASSGIGRSFFVTQGQEVHVYVASSETLISNSFRTDRTQPPHIHSYFRQRSTVSAAFYRNVNKIRIYYHFYSHKDTKIYIVLGRY